MSLVISQILKNNAMLNIRIIIPIRYKIPSSSAIELLLFAFSTAIAWSYYGDRSTAYIFGEGAVPWYRMIYVVCFIAAAVVDTTVIWNIAYVVVALVTIPNLIALFVLRKEMKEQVNSYVMEK